ncbi:MAG: hypothetical protein AAFY70_01955 [Bacteroidota bacterium]
MKGLARIETEEVRVEQTFGRLATYLTAYTEDSLQPILVDHKDGFRWLIASRNGMTLAVACKWYDHMELAYQEMMLYYQYYKTHIANQ